MFKFLLKIFKDFFTNFFSISISPTALYVVYNFNSYSWRISNKLIVLHCLQIPFAMSASLQWFSFLILKTQKFPTYVLPFNSNRSWMYLPAIFWINPNPPAFPFSIFLVILSSMLLPMMAVLCICPPPISVEFQYSWWFSKVGIWYEEYG